MFYNSEDRLKSNDEGTERRVGRTTLEKLNSAQGRQAAEHPVAQTLPGAWRMGNVSLLGNPRQSSIQVCNLGGEKSY